MIDWQRLTLLMYILMRMSGFVLFIPLLGRQNVPAIFRVGLTLVLTWTVGAFTPGFAPVPATIVELAVRLLLEFGLGMVVGIVTQFFITMIPLAAGEIVDNQMALSMAQTYDPSTSVSMSSTGNMLNSLAMLVFFTENGHNTLLRILLTSGNMIPFGQARIGASAMEAGAQLFIECFLLAVKLTLPIMAAELLGQIGMGILMKVIPQINVFSINIELKVIIGLLFLLLFMSPISEFLLKAENEMLLSVEGMIKLLAQT
jgi:flagellar biosynthetic protein FliR